MRYKMEEIIKPRLQPDDWPIVANSLQHVNRTRRIQTRLMDDGVFKQWVEFAGQFFSRAQVDHGAHAVVVHSAYNATP